LDEGEESPGEKGKKKGDPPAMKKRAGGGKRGGEKGGFRFGRLGRFPFYQKKKSPT